MSVTVAQLAIAPVKGMRLTAVEELEVGPAGPVGDRAFVVVDAENKQVRTSRTAKLLQVTPSWDAVGGELALRFPDGEVVRAVVEPGAAASTTGYDGRIIPGRLVDGTLAEALSGHLGRPVRLLARDLDVRGADDAPVTVMSEASLAALAPALGGAVPDGRRFRMTITLAGVDAWEEHGWGGRELAIGDARLRVTEPVPRCVVTTRNPEEGRTDAPILKALATLRGKDDVNFGVWCEVVAPGRVRRGDAVAG